MAVEISAKINGFRIQIHKNDGVKVYTDGGKERSTILPDLVREIQSLRHDNFILDGELILIKDGQLIPRAEMAKVGVGKEPIRDEETWYYVFDIPYHEEDISQKPLSERLKILDKILPKDLKYIKRMPSWEVSNKKEYDAAVKKAIAFPASEGFMGKELESLYEIGRGPGWVKVKITYELKIKTIGILIEPNPWPEKPDGDLTGQEALDAFKKLQKKSETYILWGAILGKDGKTLIAIESDHRLSQGDLELRWDAKRKVWSGTEDPHIWQMGAGFKNRGKSEIAYGKTYAKKLDPAPRIGDIATIRPTTMRFFKRPDGTQGIAWENPRLEEIDTERTEPDIYIDAERIIKASSQQIKKAEEDISALAKVNPDKWLNWKLKVAPNKYPQHYAIMSEHFRGASAHLDFRVKFNSHLRGWTIDDQPAGIIKEDINTIEQGRKITDQTEWKFGPDMDPNKKVLVERKASQPQIWINVARENVVEPGSTGACLTEVDVLMARGWQNIRGISRGHKVSVRAKAENGLMIMQWDRVQEVFENPADPKQKYEIKVGEFYVGATYDHLWYCAHIDKSDLISDIAKIGWELTKDIFLEALKEDGQKKDKDGDWYEHPYIYMTIPIQGLKRTIIKQFRQWGWKSSRNKYWLLHPIMIREFDGVATTYNLSIKKHENYLTPLGISHNTRFEEGVFITRAVGFAYPGIRRPYFEEYFLDMKGPKEIYYRKRLVFRQIATPEEPKKMRTPLKTPTFWAGFIAKTDTPYILTTRGRKKRDWVPDGKEIISGLPPWWEEKVPEEMRWWGKDLSRAEMLNHMDDAYAYLKEKAKAKKQKVSLQFTINTLDSTSFQEYLRHNADILSRTIQSEIQEAGLVKDTGKALLRPDSIDLRAGKTRRFVLNRHYYKGQCVDPSLEIAAPMGLIKAGELKDRNFILASDLKPLEIIKAHRIVFPRYLKIVYGLTIYDPQKENWKSGQWTKAITENTPIWIRSADDLYEGWVRADALKQGDKLKIPVFICSDCGFRAPSFILYKHLSACNPDMTQEKYSQQLIKTAIEIGQTFFVYTPIKKITIHHEFRSFISLEVKSRWTSARSFLSALGPVHNTVVRDLPIEHWDLIMESDSNKYLEEYQFEFNPLEIDGPLSARLNKLQKPPFNKKDIVAWFTWEGKIPAGKFGNPNKTIPAFIEQADAGKVVIAEENNQRELNFEGKRLKGKWLGKQEDTGVFWQFEKS